MSPRVMVTWQTSQFAAITECTDFPVILLAWQDEHSASFGKTPGCSTAAAGAASKQAKIATAHNIHLVARLPENESFHRSRFIDVAQF